MEKIKTYTLYPDQSVWQSICEQAESPYSIFGVQINGRIVRLEEVPEEKIKGMPLTIQHPDGYRIYYHTVVALCIAALTKLYPDFSVQVEHFIGDALYIAPKSRECLTALQLTEVEQKMREYVDSDLLIKRTRFPYPDAMKILEKQGFSDTILLYSTLKPEFIDLHEIDGNFFAFHNYLAPSAGFASQFDVKGYYPGAVLLFETPTSNGRVAPFKEQRALAQTYERSRSFLKQIETENVGRVNQRILRSQCSQLIHLTDTKLEQRLQTIAYTMVKSEEIRLILISGPSASAKTTTSKKLALHMGAMGKFPITISMDDYFVDRARTPVDADGTLNFESTDAIDYKRFNEDMLALLEGNSVHLPTFNFVEGKSKRREVPIRIDRTHPIIVEGIHGLNPMMTEAIPEKNKCKIYVSALAQLNIDDHNRISATDVRFLRRLVRDAFFRGNDAERTFELWSKVRASEDKEIFPFQEEADLSVDTSLIYEVFVLRQYAIPLLKSIGKSSMYHKDSRRLLRFLDYFLDIDGNLLPTGSLLREFIGGSPYEGDMQWI